MGKDPQLRLLANLLAQGPHKSAWTAVKPFPYGVWSTSDGRQVMFDRHYHPLWQRSNGVVRNADAFVAHLGVKTATEESKS